MYLNLKKYREEAGFTQKEVEEKLGLRRLSIRDYESERLKLPSYLAVEFAKLYGVSLDQLLGLAEESDKNPFDYFNDAIFGNSLIILYKDKILKAYFEEMTEVSFKDSLLGLMSKKLNLGERKKFNEHFLNSLILLALADEKVHDKELVALKKISQLLELKIPKSDKLSQLKIDFSLNVLSHIHLKHFLIWMLFFFAYTDGEASREEINFIENYAVNIKMNRSNFLDIKETFVEESSL